MSGTGQGSGAPSRLTPIAPDQPIGTTADGQPVLPSFYFSQMIQRILSYLGQPAASSSGTSGGSTTKTVSEQLTIATASSTSISLSAGPDGHLLQQLSELRARTFGFPPNDSGAPLPWGQLPAEAQELPLAFILAGKPPTAQVYNLALAMAITVPANLAGTVFFCSTTAAANAAFTVNQISGGTTTAIATITVAAGSHTAITLSTQAAVSFAAGDVLQIVAPTQDSTLADMCFTILAAKV